MPSNSMTSRERMLAAIDGAAVDHVPCSFMMYKALLTSSESYTDFVERQIEMGLDSYVMLPPRPPVVVNDYYNLHGLPVSYDPRVEIREWVEHAADSQWATLVKQYHTPAGTLRTEVRRTEDWRWGDHVPFLDDYLVSRSQKFLVTRPEDLEALRYLLVPPTDEEIRAAREESQPALDLARRRQLAICGGWGVGADLIGWIHGLENMVCTTFDSPSFMHELLDIISAWNRKRMEILLEMGIDLYIKRAWYETTLFWTPASFREFILPILSADVRLAHENGTRFGYIATAGCMPLLEYYKQAGVDVLIGVDPHEWDLATTKQKLAGAVSLWGGVNGHLAVEQGPEEQVRREVQEAMRTLAPGGGFILSPVDNVRENTRLAQQNVVALIDEWQRLRGQVASHAS